jgi:hypothetical protein
MNIDEIVVKKGENEMTPTICAVVLNWNNYRDTKECVESLLKSSLPLAAVIIVDNASKDGSNDKLKRDFKDFASVYFIENPDNYGFAKGVNMGLRFALEKGAEYVLLLNNDAVINVDCIEKLYEALINEPKAAIDGPKILYYKMPQRIWTGESNFSYLKTGIISLQKNKIDDGKDRAIKEVTFLTGCTMLIKKSLFEKIGFFDEDYFFYYEDVDFCLRTIKGGFKILYVPSAKVWHKIGTTSETRTSEFYVYHMGRSHILFLRKNFSGFYFIYGVMLVFFFFTPFRILQIIHGSKSCKAVLGWFRGIFAGFSQSIMKGGRNIYENRTRQ